MLATRTHLNYCPIMEEVSCKVYGQSACWGLYTQRRGPCLMMYNYGYKIYGSVDGHIAV